MGAIIAIHNSKVLSTSATTPSPEASCKCRYPQDCPIGGNCKGTCIVYKATIAVPNKPTKVYYRLAQGTFKARYSVYQHSLRNEERRFSTEYSKYMWDLKDLGLEGSTTWEIAKPAAIYKCGSRRCDLCLTEKLMIAMADSSSLFNKRSEIVSTCRHRKKFTCERVAKELLKDKPPEKASPVPPRRRMPRSR